MQSGVIRPGPGRRVSAEVGFAHRGGALAPPDPGQGSQRGGRVRRIEAERWRPPDPGRRLSADLGFAASRRSGGVARVLARGVSAEVGCAPSRTGSARKGATLGECV